MGRAAAGNAFGPPDRAILSRIYISKGRNHCNINGFAYFVSLTRY